MYTKYERNSLHCLDHSLKDLEFSHSLKLYETAAYESISSLTPYSVTELACKSIAARSLQKKK